METWLQTNVTALALVVLLGLPMLYAARRPMHAVIRNFGNLVANPFRLLARSLLRAAGELRRRNRAVLLAHGREETGKLIEREFERVDAVVRRDLQGYPALQRKLMDEITRIEEDYQKCGEVPPSPPEWTRAVAEIAQIKQPAGDRMVEKLLGDIHESVNRIHDEALKEYRKAYAARHKILDRFQPMWRSLMQTLDRVDKSMTGLQERATVIDAQMAKYKEINAKTDEAERVLSSSALIQFAISAFVLLIAFGGTVVNFNLIALPMSEMVGASSYVGNVRTSDIAALVIILVEATMGLFLMECLRITHLFPGIGLMNDKLRHRLLWVSLTLLVVLAGIEAALAYMRDMIAADNQALRQSLSAATPVVTSSLSWIPTAGQMVLGFILPFALAFIAIPLESFIYAARTVLGNVIAGALRSVAVVLRFVGQTARQLADVAIALYDAVIFIPLLIERYFSARGGAAPVASPTVRPFERTGRSL